MPTQQRPTDDNLVAAADGRFLSTPSTSSGSRGSGGAPLAFSIPQFCKLHNISIGFYYELKKRGLGPREMELGSRRLISVEEAAAWWAARTANTVPTA